MTAPVMPTTTDAQTDEQIVAVAETATRFVVTHPLPDDTRLTVAITNYDGQDRYPALDGVWVRVHVATANADYVAELVTKVFGIDAEPEGVDVYPNVCVTRWRDTVRVALDWTCPLAADEPTEPDASDIQDVLDDRKWEAFHEAGGHR